MCSMAAEKTGQERRRAPEPSPHAAGEGGRFRHLIDENADGILIVDDEGYVRFVNQAAERLLGRPASELLDELFGFPLAGESMVEIDILRADGNCTVAEMHVVKTRWESRDAYLASLRDVSERQRMEQELRESQARYRTLFESAGDAIFIHDLTGRFLEVNQVACERLGYSRAELLQLTPADIDAPEFAAQVPERIAELKARGEGFFETRHVRRDGSSIPIEINARIIEYEGAPAVLSIARDITERQRAEERIAHLNAVLRAIRNVNQLITQEQDRDRLLQGACDTLIETRGYFGAWIAILDVTRKTIGFAAAGLQREEIETMEVRLEASTLPACAEALLARQGLFVIEDSQLLCEGCPFQQHDDCYGIMTTRLQYDDHLYGMLTVAAPRAYVHDAEEQSLFEEVAGDLAFALHSMALEEQRFRAAEALRQSERKLDLILETLVDGVVVVDLEGQITYANRAAGEILGLSLDVPAGHYYRGNCWQQIDEQGRPYPPAALPLSLALREQRAVQAIEYGILADDQRFKWLSVNAAPLCAEQGALVGAVASFRDITTGREMEAALKSRERELQLLFAESGTPIFVADPEERFVTANPAALEFLECTLEKLQGRSVWDFVPPEQLARIQREHRPFVRRRSHEVDYLVRGRVKTLLLNVVPVSIDGRTLLYGIGLDITERKQNQEQLRRYAEELRRSNRDLEQFAYVASHDLQEPLRMVRSYVELLARRYTGQLDADADDFIGFAIEGTQRMQSLIQGLLSYSRLESMAPSSLVISVPAIIEQVLANLHLVISERRVVVQQGALPQVLGDPSQITQLFQNLIDNAIKFNLSERPTIVITAQPQGDEWRFAIEDNGVGIAPEHYDRVFQIFQRLNARDEYPGTGLGLPLCKKIVERHGGRLWLESRVGAGTTFFFTLPAAPDGSEGEAG